MATRIFVLPLQLTAASTTTTPQPVGWAETTAETALAATRRPYPVGAAAHQTTIVMVIMLAAVAAALCVPPLT